MKRSLLLFLGVCLLASTLWAEPYYTVLFGQSCFLCHQNPTGRGLRSNYGSQFFAPRYLPKWPPSDSTLAKFSPMIGQSVIIGADFRQIWMAEDTPAPGQRGGLSAPFSTNTGTDAQMNGDLYVGFQPTEYISLRYTQDLRNMLRWEAYGMVHGSLKKPALHGYIKGGQFQENYGWAFADHSSFVRTGLWEGYMGGVSAGNPPTPPRYGVGGEIGLSGYHVNLTGSLTDDADNAIPGPQDTPKRFMARAMVQQGIEKWGLEFTGGGSWRDQPSFGPDTTQQRWWGGFGGIGWQGLQNTLGCNGGFGFLTTAALFEYDRKAWHPGIVYSGAVTSAYSTTQLSIMVHPGVWLLGDYDWLDNTGRKDGQEAQRYSVGLQLFPWPWVDIIPMYRLYKPVPFSGVRTRVRHGELQAHFLF